MAAAEDRYGVDIALFPAGSDATSLDGRPVARCTFVEGGGVPDPLFAEVPRRRTLKEPFDMIRPVDRATLDAVLAAARAGSVVGGTVDAAEVAALRALSHEALRIEIDTPHTYKESVDLFRIGSREIEANPDGIDFSGPMFEAMALTGTFTREAALDRSSVAFREGEKAVFANTDTAMGHLWQVTAGNSRADQIEAGRDWMRLNLAATALGLGVQPLSQALAGISRDGRTPCRGSPDAGAGRRHRANVRPGGIRAIGARQPQMDSGDQDPEWMSKVPERMYFRLFNEVGIIDQISRAFLEARLPDGLIISHFTVINHLIRVADGPHAPAAGHCLSGAQDDA